jgi:hypothetical protein
VQRDRRPHLHAALIALAIACSDPPPADYDTITFADPRELGDPEGERCEEIGARRVCFGEAGPHVVPSIAPPAPPDATWRCSGQRCALVPRRPFECEGGQCRQRYARMPDDADWECADVRGLVVCRDRATPAAIVPGPPELGWICGEGSPRVCIDLSPDRPGAGNYDCSFEHEPVPGRICAPSRATTLGGPCSRECPDSMVCVEGVCLPSAIATPDCWTDADCERGERCALASCAPSS